MAESDKYETLSDVDEAIEAKVKELDKSRGSDDCFALLIGDRPIDGDLVDKVFNDLRNRFKGQAESKRLLVILESSGGDIDASYNLAQLFRRYGTDHLEVMIPRWAKSAATLLACSGDIVSMTPVAELGPVDPQITALNPLEGRLEKFSPLDIESTLELIRNEYSNGNKEMAEGLMQRLQFPLTLGSFKKTLDLSRLYLERLLATRMLSKDAEKAKKAAELLTTGYPSHGYCIDLTEVCELGLNAREIEEPQLSIVWKLHNLSRKRQELVQEEKRQETEKKLRELPPTLRDNLPPGLLDED